MPRGSARRARTARDLARRTPSRRSKDRILIVCEGGKTEPNYLRELKGSLGLTNADVEICGDECGSDPASVVNYGIQRFAQDPGFDRIFCVFDRDTRTTYDRAIDRTRRKRMPAGKHLDVVRSIPCFEYWILLHFEFTCATFVKAGFDSACDSVIQRLKKYIPGYAKGSKSLYSLLEDRTAVASEHALRALKNAKAAGTDNPTTEVCYLIDYLREAATGRKPSKRWPSEK